MSPRIFHKSYYILYLQSSSGHSGPLLIRCKATRKLDLSFRLTFYEKLTDVIPDEFSSLLPSKPGFNHKFAEPAPENSLLNLQTKCGKALIESIKNKDEVDMMMASLEPLPEGSIDGKYFSEI